MIPASSDTLPPAAWRAVEGCSPSAIRYVPKAFALTVVMKEVRSSAYRSVSAGIYRASYLREN